MSLHGGGTLQTKASTAESLRPRADPPRSVRDAADEYDYDDRLMQVSITDLEGNVTYVNDAFIEVCGFSAEELLGKPRKMLRHEDMPGPAFDDMWRTIRAGQPWNALVMNRRKNGQTYWVDANVTPVMRAGAPHSYLSVWVRPTDEAKRKAQAQYARIRQGRRPRLSFAEGRVVRADVPGRLARALGGLARYADPLCWILAAAGLSLVSTLAEPLTALTFGIGTCLVFGLLSLRREFRMRRWVGEVRDRANMIAAGDLAVSRSIEHHETRTSGLPEALKQVALNIMASVGDVRARALDLDTAGSRLLTGVETLAARTRQTTTDLQRITSATSELSGTAMANAENAEKVRLLAEQAMQSVDRGCAASAQVSDGMTDVMSHSRTISEIVSVIDEVASHTNLLALNASVEAARAGAAGHGFSVVASEVRALAQRSTRSAGEIRKLVQETIASIESTVTLNVAMSASMREIHDTVHGARDEVMQITEASKAQALAAAQVTDTVRSVHAATQLNGAFVEDYSADIGRLRVLTGQLRDSFSVFHIGSE